MAGRIAPIPEPELNDAVSKRTEKLQIMLSDEELGAIDDWRFQNRLPSRAAAIRELIRRGLANAAEPAPERDKSSGEYAVVVENGEPDENP
jgi:hypothetical protein